MKTGTNTFNKTETMKRLNLYCMALAVLAIFSCAREQEVLVPESAAGMKFTAVWSDEASRTSLDENGTSVLWDPGDEIFVFQGVTEEGPSAMGKFTSTNTARQSTATFTGTLEGECSGDYIAVYPYYEFHKEGTALDISEMGYGVGTIVAHILNPVQQGVEGSFDTRTAPAAAISSTNELVFHNICGGVRFSVSQSGIKKAVFTSVDGSHMSGPTYITFDEDGIVVIPSEWMEAMENTIWLSDVEVIAPEGGFVPGKYYYAMMWPHIHAEGIKVTLYGDGVKAERILSGPVTVKRSVFGVIDDIDSGVEYVPTTPVPEIVDLGLSVKWASFNLGASAPEEYGDYFAWGETAPRFVYGLSYFYDFYDLVYKWYKGEDGSLTKYCNQSEYGYNGFTDNKTVLDPEDDAATVNLGDNWRMPTLVEYQELLENCTSTWTTLNGVNGMKFTSNKPGYADRCVFLPAAGVNMDYTYQLYAESIGFYWSSTLDTDNPHYAYDVRFASGIGLYGTTFRSYGLPVRPVYAGEIVHVTGIALNESSLQIEMGSTAQLIATVTPEDASNKSVVWTSSDESIATVSEDGVVTGVGIGTAEITATSVDGGFTAKCTIEVKYAVPEIVDLGLPSGIKWASFNLGASSPEGYGDYFAWGETEPKDNYSWSAYKWCMGNEYTITKYCDDSEFGYNGFTDNKIILDPEDDAAAVALGGSWRTPTEEELRELLKNCTWTGTSQNGINGKLVTGPNGNSIFLPAAGVRYGTSLPYVGWWGAFLSSSHQCGPSYACYMYFDDSDYAEIDYEDRYLGRSVRPVYDGPADDVPSDVVHVTSVVLNLSNLQIYKGETAQFTATITPENASNKSVVWTSSNESVATVSEDGVVTGTGVGTAEITATTVDGNLKSTCTVKVTRYEIATPEAVDLGLSVKWASFNLGASSPEGYGDYFAWGETTPKDNYSWSTYKWCMNGRSSQLTKYCNDSLCGYNGFTDNKSVLDPEDDAAAVALGGSWRMPTLSECQELLDNCTKTWTTLNGVYGRKFTSNKTGYTDKWIFLPAAGYRDGASLNDAGADGGCWSSSLYTDNPYFAYCVYLFSANVYWYSDYRYFGQSVRPVTE